MPGTKEIKQRIKSVKNTKKITKAMELVAASKMKRAVSRALSSRLYASYSWELLTSLSSRLDDVTHPFFTDSTSSGQVESKRELLVLITSNGGLCGAYNAQVIKRALVILKDTNGKNTDMITVGKKGDNAMRRVGQNIIASFTEMPDNNITLNDIVPLSKFIVNEYKLGKYMSVSVVYTDFISALTQKANSRKILPISKEEIKEMIEEIGAMGHKKDLPKESPLGKQVPYIFDGDINTLIESLAEKLVRMQIYQMVLESSASEQSSRMVAMKNASEAAGEMIGDLTLVFNKARQAGITQEISEISAGMASIS